MSGRNCVDIAVDGRYLGGFLQGGSLWWMCCKVSCPLPTLLSCRTAQSDVHVP